MNNDNERADSARTILLDWEARNKLFPETVFDETGWTILLHLFVSFNENAEMSEGRLISLIRKSATSAQRWLYYLQKDGQVENRLSGDDVIITSGALNNLRTYLDMVQV